MASCSACMRSRRSRWAVVAWPSSDRKSTRLNSSHSQISYAVFCLKTKFPQATYVVQRGELEFARHTNQRTQASYLAHNFESIIFQTSEGEIDVLLRIRSLPSPAEL